MFSIPKWAQSPSPFEPEPPPEPTTNSTTELKARRTPRKHESQFLTGDQLADSETVTLLLGTIAQISRSRDLDLLLTDFVDRSIELTGAERGLLLLCDDQIDGTAEGGAELVQRVARIQGGLPLEGPVRFSTSIALQALNELEPIRAAVDSEADAMSYGDSFHGLHLRRVLCVPLTVKSAGDGQAKAAGVLYVDSRALRRPFTERELSLFAALARHCSIVLDNAHLEEDRIEKVRLEQSLELAGAIQRDLMRSTSNDLSGYDVHACYEPAETAAGDLYDVLNPKCGGLALAVGDVTGHGIGPALITAAAQGSLSAYLSVLDDPCDVVTRLNRDLCAKVEDGRFLTLCLVLLSDSGELVAVNAGHPAPLIWRKETGALERIEGAGPALGFIDGETYRALEPSRLESGDVLCLYSDGLTEARRVDDRADLFGEAGVERVFADAAASGLGAREISRAVVDAALGFASGEREDDITIVVARRA